MSEIINLNRVRKARDKAAARATAASNRVLHGLSKAERDAAKAEQERAGRTVDGHRLDRQEPEPDPGQDPD